VLNYLDIYDRIPMASRLVKNPVFWLVCTAFVALMLRLGFVIALSEPGKIVQFIGDDPFYYFQLASNLIRGYGTSIDGEIITNGYHPLWVVLISPLFLLRDIDQILPVRLALMLSGALSIGVGMFIFLTARKLTGDGWLALFAAGVYLFTERIFLFDMFGEPSPLSNLLIAVLIYIVAKVAVSGLYPNKLLVWFGIAGGLAILARTDNLVFFGLFSLLLLFWMDEPKRLVRVFASLVIALIVISPWLIWNWAVFGTVIQSSADACPTLFRTLALGENPELLDTVKMSVNRALDGGSLDLLFSYFPLRFALLIIIAADYYRNFGLGVFLRQSRKIAGGDANSLLYRHQFPPLFRARRRCALFTAVAHSVFRPVHRSNSRVFDILQFQGARL